ncbi:MAG: hypothetical protein BGO54_15445 [Sphingobacteriales bacterium 46-32]|nr:MAG: hypothetical protein BGO54_15445 [Sphingobacteriales bacterium 46-32]
MINESIRIFETCPLLPVVFFKQYQEKLLDNPVPYATAVANHLFYSVKDIVPASPNYFIFGIVVSADNPRVSQYYKLSIRGFYTGKYFCFIPSFKT